MVVRMLLVNEIDLLLEPSFLLSFAPKSLFAPITLLQNDDTYSILVLVVSRRTGGEDLE